jgi:protein-disulfide isomerase
MSKQFLAVLAAIVLIFVGIVLITSKSNSTSSTSSNKVSEHIEGEGKDHVTLTEYGDYECPYCGEYYPTLKTVQAKYSQEIYFQFRNFPLTSLHPHAFAGSRAAEAAGEQGKYWQMHDLLYEQNETYYDSNEQAATWINAPDSVLLSQYFDADAKQLGLNVAKFNTAYNSNAVNDVIDADMSEGQKLGIEGTPTFFINGKQITQPANSVSAFSNAINAAIAKNKTATSSTSTSASKS